MSQPDGQCHAQELSGVRCLVVRDPRGKASASRPFVCKQHEDAAKKASKEAKADLRLQLQAGQVGNVPALTYGQSGKLIDQITWIAPSSASQPLVVYIFKDTKRHRLESFEAAVQLLLPDILAEVGDKVKRLTLGWSCLLPLNQAILQRVCCRNRNKLKLPQVCVHDSGQR